MATDTSVAQTETKTRSETSTASEVVRKVANAPAVPSVCNMDDIQQTGVVRPPSSTAENSTRDVLEFSTVHNHRLSHTPSRLPGLRLVDCGQRQIGQNTPGPGPRSVPQPAVASVSSHSAGANSTTAPGSPPGPFRAANITNCQLPSDDSPWSQSRPPPSPSSPDFVPPIPISTPPSGKARALPLSPLLQPAIADDNEGAGQHHRSDSTSAVAQPLLHSTASSDHQTSALQTTTAPEPTTTTAPTSTGKVGKAATLLRSTSTGFRTPAKRSESGTDSSRYYTPPTRPPSRRDSSWDTSPLAAHPPAPARRNSSWDSISAITTLASCPPGTATNTESAHGPPQSTLPTGADSSFSDEHHKVRPRRVSSASRPPVSYRPTPPLSASGRIAPTRGFRPYRTRRSSFEMLNSSSRYYDDVDENHNPSSRERSLLALEGRYSDARDDAAHAMDLDDDVAESENNTADIFMTIARENSSTSIPRRNANQGSDDEQNTVSRVVRTARIPRSRPQSIYTSTVQKLPSPPPVARRLSDNQLSTSRMTRRVPNEQHEPQSNRDAHYQNSAIGRPGLKVDPPRGLSRAPALKASPTTPRTQSVLDNSADRGSIFARRPTTRNGDGHARSSSIKQPSGLSKSFSASPSIPKGGISQQMPNGQHVETSESSNSTAAPSTVWDELDELKSRIHRLELTGKLPKTSSAAISRTPEERPPTAGTGATTLSGSPKRAQTEVISLASSQKETQSNLKTILSKTKPFVSSDVYDAIEAAANDALSLSQLMGTAGQPGPIASGASTIGVGGPSTITDRQLRKKADSICRSLTELCIALKEEEPDRKTTSISRPQTRGTSRSGRDEVPRSPGMKVFNGSGPDEPFSSIEGYDSPRVTRLDKRATFNFTGLSGMSNVPSPRYSSSVIGGGDEDTMTGRKSSLVLARARRGVTEEPDDNGRKTTLLRTRRAASEETDEQEDSRRSSMVFAPRRVTTIGRVSNIDEEPQMQSRAPSRAFTEVSNARTEVGNGLRINVPLRDSIARRPMAQEPASANTLSRARLHTSGLPTPGPYSSRMMTPTTPGARRFLQITRQQAQEENHTSNITERLAEERGQRYSIGGSTATGLSRGPSLHRKRHSAIPNISGTASNAGGYR